MTRDGRAAELAAEAARLAAEAGVELPDRLRLWRLAGGRRAARAASAGRRLDGPAAAWELVGALEARLHDGERRQGAHYTPRPLADAVVAAAGVGPGAGAVVDPACGGGALLLAAAARAAEPGRAGAVVERLHGADVDPLAVAVAEAALALWAGGAAPSAERLAVADALVTGRDLWPCGPAAGFDHVVGNPPFQGQLASDTARDGERRDALRRRFGPAAARYVDTAALFLLAAVDLARPGGRVALLQPRSVVAARDAGPVRAALAERARLVDLVVPDGRPFAARVHVCIPVLEVGAAERSSGTPPPWAARLAAALGVPPVELAAAAGTVGDRAEVVAGFRRHYYGLVPHVTEAPEGRASSRPGRPLVTSGLLDVGACAWGHRPVRFGRRSWARPVVDVAAVGASDPALRSWLDLVRRPKVVVGTQTRVVEAAADRTGTWVPCTPVVAVVPHDPAQVDRLAAVLCAPPVAAWAATEAAGSGLSAGAIRVSADLLRHVPLPVDDSAWAEAAARLGRGDLAGFGAAATAMYRLPAGAADAVGRWWESRLGPARARR